jgi:hypothetical protein
MDWSSADFVDVTDLASVPVQGSGMFNENKDILENGLIERFEQCSVASDSSADGHSTMDIDTSPDNSSEQDATSNDAGHMNVDANDMNVDTDDIIIRLETPTPEVESAEAVETVTSPVLAQLPPETMSAVVKTFIDNLIRKPGTANRISVRASADIVPLLQFCITILMQRIR